MSGGFSKGWLECFYTYNWCFISYFYLMILKETKIIVLESTRSLYDWTEKSCTAITSHCPIQQTNFSKALYGTARGTCSARLFRPVWLLNQRGAFYSEMFTCSTRVFMLDINESWNLKEKRCTRWSLGLYSLLCSVNKCTLTMKRGWGRELIPRKDFVSMVVLRLFLDHSARMRFCWV